MSDRAEHSHHPAEGTYWRQESGSEFTLLLENRPAARVDLIDNTAIIVDRSASPDRLVAPDSQSIFDVVERRLGTGRVDEWVGMDGGDAVTQRHRAEDRATAFRREVPAAREPQHHLTSAWKWLEQGAHERTLSPAGYQARIHVRAALREFAIHDRWTPEARLHVSHSFQELEGLEACRQSLAEQRAGVDCAKAHLCLREQQTDHSFARAVTRAAQVEARQADRGSDRQPD